jgi:hypothetical protein
MSGLLNSGVHITNIVGNFGSSTIQTIVVKPTTDTEKWTHGEVEELETGIGDGTVTETGSHLDDSIQDEKWTGVNHTKLPRETSARVFNIFTNRVADNVIFLTPIEKILSIQLQSPIDFVITDPDGKRIGKNFSNNTEYDEILGAFYSGFQTDEEYITIPNPLNGEYKIELQGTEGGGAYGVLTSYISEEFATTTRTQGIIEVDQITKLSVRVGDTDQEVIVTEKEVSVETLISDINKAYDLGWITDKNTRDRLIKQIKAVAKFNKKKRIYEKKVDKILVRLFEIELNILLRRGKINEQGYNIIRDDLNWLINNN